MVRSKEGTQFESRATITIDGVTYEHVAIQRGGLSAIYRAGDKFLRIGSPEKIQKDLEIHKEMESKGFPIAKLISEGTHEGMDYFTEASLGENHFGDIFKDEVEKTGMVRDETFEKFIAISERWAESQLNNASDIKDWDGFKKGIHLDDLCDEMPEDRERIVARYEKAKESLAVFPFTLTHGDFGPFNMYPEGVIDLESSFSGPAPYDAGSLVTHLEWLPESKDYETSQLYTFTPEQKELYLARIDALYVGRGLPKVSDYLADLDFLKGIWFAVKLGHVPKLQKFRFDCLRKHL